MVYGFRFVTLEVTSESVWITWLTNPGPHETTLLTSCPTMLCSNALDYVIVINVHNRVLVHNGNTVMFEGRMMNEPKSSALSSPETVTILPEQSVMR